MKIPGSNGDQSGDNHQAAIRDANARASRAQEEAVLLRDRLESMENLLAQTKSKLAEANSAIQDKDKRLINVQTETKALAQSVGYLEGRFQNLKKMQTELAEKRETLLEAETRYREPSPPPTAE